MFRREERLRFWSDPDTEIKLAQGTNSTVFRMGVDWSRIMPIEPISGIENAVSLFFGTFWYYNSRFLVKVPRLLDSGGERFWRKT